ncbi:hypothetical protein DERF_001607 [Dermatophagoides farinae]|uniref:Uncharacterized protein n=1 Tax=Dermatophagoides farinae TaxID=6954 RepID=A0A922IAT6_DERFA|nr:hypothetical protein DERF_001607 [Dermatophagoides farinae]
MKIETDFSSLFQCNKGRQTKHDSIGFCTMLVFLAQTLIEIKYSFCVLQKKQPLLSPCSFRAKIDTVLTCATTRLSSLELYSMSI